VLDLKIRDHLLIESRGVLSLLDLSLGLSISPVDSRLLGVERHRLVLLLDLGNSSLVANKRLPLSPVNILNRGRSRVNITPERIKLGLNFLVGASGLRREAGDTTRPK
jgi:hypothetical protein